MTNNSNLQTFSSKMSAYLVSPIVHWANITPSIIILSSLLKVWGAIKRMEELRPTIFATYKEDRLLPTERWNERYTDKRVVFWDDTNINLPTPNDGSLNRRSYSNYYGGSVDKRGGVLSQLCGWVGVWYLWTGAVSESAYLSKSGILVKQRMLHQRMRVATNTVKGYHCYIAAWKNGRQSILQPTFAKSDKQFTTTQLISSAVDRGGNERAVNVCKRSGLLKRGLANHASTEDLDDASLTRSFQSNFMFNRALWII